MVKSEEISWQRQLITQIRRMLYHPDTGLVYDYITSYDPLHRFDYLPSPEEIALGFPNPCGWSTGMEDCAINTGLMLHLLSRQKGENHDWIQHLTDGLIQCGTIHGTPGFIARGILPEDGRSCYINSSRDQFTVAASGLWQALQAGCLDSSRRRKAEQLLADTAEFCRKRIVPEYDFDLGRLDGGPAVVSKMWHCDPHEAMRLPMIYGMAWTVTGRKSYFDWLRQYAAEALEQTLQMDTEAPIWWDMPLLQTQLSLEFFIRSGVLPELRSGIEEAMRKNVVIASRLVTRQFREAESFPGKWEILYENWRCLPMRLRGETISPDGRSALFGGLSYANPSLGEDYAVPNSLLRAIGNYLAIIALAPGEKMPPGYLEKAENIAEKIDFSHFTGVGMVPFILGYALGTAESRLLKGE